MIIFFIMAIESDSDREFIRQIYEEYYPIMKYKALSIVKTREAAEDIVNDAIVKLINKIEILRRLDQHNMVAYMVYTVKNLSINYMNKQNKVGYYSDPEEYIQDDSDEEGAPEIIFLRKENKERVHYVLQKLEEKDRMLLINKYFMHHSDKQISMQTGIKENNVRAYIARARKKALAALQRTEGAE